MAKERHELDGIDDDEGAARWYLLTAPAGTEPVPLVVDFHGLSEGAEIHSLMSEMGELGLEQGFATAFPNGTGQPVAWEVLAEGVDSPELPYVDALLDDVLAARCIDTSRVYATGLSNGAMMTSMLACTRADRFAAFAPVAGLSTWDGCQPRRPVPILAFHGTADPILYFNGGIGDLSIVTGGEAPESVEVPEADLDGEGYPETARQWAAFNGCDPEASDEELTEEILDRTWRCPAGAPVELVIVVGGGHSWPGSEFSKQIERIVGPTTDDIAASEAMWEFFQRYQLPA
ncbi:MAG TPA: PHB depolymerase family esterase [Acidimicrobiales bacterium]|nr:PHB depolymerase family esterase [Acidimicrobiales bacterium]